MILTIGTPRRFIRAIARSTVFIVSEKSSSTLFPQLAIVEPKQLTRIPSRSRVLQTSSKAPSSRSWIFTPSMLRASMYNQPSSFTCRYLTGETFRSFVGETAEIHHLVPGATGRFVSALL